MSKISNPVDNIRHYIKSKAMTVIAGVGRIKVLVVFNRDLLHPDFKFTFYDMVDEVVLVDPHRRYSMLTQQIHEWKPENHYLVVVTSSQTDDLLRKLEEIKAIGANYELWEYRKPCFKRRLG